MSIEQRNGLRAARVDHDGARVRQDAATTGARARCSATAIAIGLAIGLGAPVVHAGGSDRAANGAMAVGAGVTASTRIRTDGPQATLEVEVKLGESDDAIVGKRLRNVATEVLTAASVQVVDGSAPSRVLVSVSWNAEDNHEIDVRVTNEGEPTQAVEGSPFVCEECNENELIGKIREVVPQCIPLLPAGPDTPPGPTGAGGSDHGHGHGNTATTGPEAAKPKPGPLGPVGKAGIWIGAAGVAGVVAGAVLLSLGERAGGDPSDRPTDFGPPGIATLVTGGALLLGGVGLIVADRVVAKRRAVSAVPVLGPRLGGVVLTGRF